VRIWSGFLLVVGGYGAYTAFRDFFTASTTGQYTAASMSLTWGMAGLLVAWSLWWRPSFTRAALLAWVATAGAAAGFASRFWGDTGVGVAIASAAVGAGFFALLARPIDRAARRGREPREAVG